MDEVGIEVSPFVVICDTREQRPWLFQGFRCDSRQGYANLVVQTRFEGLRTGDYSILGFQDQICVERKSMEDAFSTFGANRDRWERELSRMAEIPHCMVIVEAGWPAILDSTHTQTGVPRRFTPKQFYRSVISWRLSFPHIQWEFAPTDRFAERTCYRYFEAFWRKHNDGSLRTEETHSRPVAGHRADDAISLARN